ncbi:MAG: QueT transporter family protein [Oscillospiraceae bacterium]|nr:QueT transporter family protein [Oscillospiraceae bacterium]
MKNKAASKITVSAIIAALYVALTFIFPVLSFGPIQLRLSEALCLLPLCFPPAVLGVTLGCLISNLIGFLTMANPLGAVDCIFGTLATFLAAVATYYIGKKAKNKTLRLVLAPLAPVVFNAVIIALEMAIFLSGNSYGFFATMLYIGVSEALVCYVGGIGLVKGVEKFLNKKDAA